MCALVLPLLLPFSLPSTPSTLRLWVLSLSTQSCSRRCPPGDRGGWQGRPALHHLPPPHLPHGAQVSSGHCPTPPHNIHQPLTLSNPLIPVLHHPITWYQTTISHQVLGKSGLGRPLCFSGDPEQRDRGHESSNCGQLIMSFHLLHTYLHLQVYPLLPFFHFSRVTSRSCIVSINTATSSARRGAGLDWSTSQLWVFWLSPLNCECFKYHE